MTERRVDRIRRILESTDGRRARVRHVLRELRRMEGNDELRLHVMAARTLAFPPA